MRRDEGYRAQAGVSAASRAITRLQRQHFATNQRRIAELLGRQDAAFVQYERVYRRATSKWLGLSTRRALLSACRQARWIGVGDYHTLDASRRAFFELVVEARSEMPTVIALEYFTVEHQNQLDAFIAGRIGLRELRYRTGRCDAPPRRRGSLGELC